MTEETKNTHEDVVNAIRKALLEAINNLPNNGTSVAVLELAQAYERIESANVPY